MSSNTPIDQEEVPPPVPPKDDINDTRRAVSTKGIANGTPRSISTPQARRRRPAPLAGPAVKPLPPPPPAGDAVRFEKAESGAGKALPAIPWRPNYHGTILWIAALGIWFVLVVLLLPGFLAGDALPGLNRMLRSWFVALFR
ncbi:hypothetical protein PMIN03_011094 [Paraphaeosphaeria minitans]|uniref:Uncharacterized protein n=1 Tax=Paraphaeosphaeria minitans TaxID=565426 RepID=A0A9P6GAL2_9PLEO|nr:hypothetical protein PMIN01_10130 [Paraphaeosphaeria minitans]